MQERQEPIKEVIEEKQKEEAVPEYPSDLLPKDEIEVPQVEENVAKQLYDIYSEVDENITMEFVKQVIDDVQQNGEDIQQVIKEATEDVEKYKEKKSRDLSKKINEIAGEGEMASPSMVLEKYEKMKKKGLFSRFSEFEKTTIEELKTKKEEILSGKEKGDVMSQYLPDFRKTINAITKDPIKFARAAGF